MRRTLGALVTVATIVATAAAARATIPAGTSIANRATVTYSDGTGATYASNSNSLVTAVAAVSGLAITPVATGCDPGADAIPSRGTTIERFSVRNAGNSAVPFVISNATASVGRIAAIAFVSVDGATTTASDGAPSPPVPAGGRLEIDVTIDPAGVPAGSHIAIALAVATAGTTVNGASSAVGSRCAILAAPPSFGNAPGAPNTRIRKVVDGLPAARTSGGSTVSYEIDFYNTGGAPAHETVLDDPAPHGVTPLASTVRVDGNPLAAGAASVTPDGELTAGLGDIAGGRHVAITFSATVATGLSPSDALVNVASLRARDASSLRSVPAALSFGSANEVYDGAVGANAPVAGAMLTLVRELPSGLPDTNPVALLGTGATPNAANADPFVTTNDGTYWLGLGPGQGGTYELLVSAPGFVSRRIRVVLTPDPSGTYYAVTLTGLDGEPLAAPGGFAVADAPETLAATYGVFGNLPMFRPQTVSLIKSVDRAVASGGDRLVYTLVASNGGDPLGAATVTDELPAGLAYAPGTGRIDGTPQEPARAGNALTWSLPSLATQHSIVFASVVLPATQGGTTLTNSATAAAHVPTSATYLATARATATTQIVAGVFAPQTIIVGRVYLDRAATGRYGPGDVPLAGVRIIVEDGESVLTDRDGEYDFPALRPGMHVLQLDRTTLPPGIRPFANRRFDDERSTVRLLHDTLNSGLTRTVDFALDGAVPVAGATR